MGEKETGKDRATYGVFWASRDGFSTVGIALALLISLCLIFTAARVYEINSISNEIQEVADAAALAAENVVAEFYIVVAVCDAIVLTLSLVLILTLGLAVVCLCTPVTEGFAKTFLDISKQLKNTRDSFSQTAQESLDTYQDILPFLAITKSQSVFQANSSLPNASGYSGLTLLVPWEANRSEELSFDKSDTAQSEIDDKCDELQQKGKEAEERAQKAKESKERAYIHDSGSEDAYCMYERSKKLAGMSGAENPYFSSVETWSFSAALERAKTYYKYRYENETPHNDSVDEKANSALRKNFYEYAVSEVEKGYVIDTEETFEANFPLLPKNTEEMRATSLYTNQTYPISQGSDGMIMHAWNECPAVLGAQMGFGSIQQMETGSFRTCSVCKFKASSMGSVAAASTNIENGFEYHYLIVAQSAKEYEAARKDLSPLSEEVKSLTDELFDFLSEAFDQAVNQRINVSPPGRYGVVSLACCSNHQSQFSRFSSLFISSENDLSTCVALSAATLVKDSTGDNKTVINSVLDGYAESSNATTGPAGVALDLWSGLLGVYGNGQQAVVSSIEKALNSIPLASESGLGVKAAKSLEEKLESFGLAPVDLSSPKSVLINSEHVLSADESAISANLLSLKRFVLSSPIGGENMFGETLDTLEGKADEIISDISQEFTIATIELFDGAVSIPVTMVLPDFMVSTAKSLFESGILSLRSLAYSITGMREWR